LKIIWDKYSKHSVTKWQHSPTNDSDDDGALAERCLRRNFTKIMLTNTTMTQTMPTTAIMMISVVLKPVLFVDADTCATTGVVWLSSAANDALLEPNVTVAFVCINGSVKLFASVVDDVGNVCGVGEPVGAGVGVGVGAVVGTVHIKHRPLLHWYDAEVLLVTMQSSLPRHIATPSTPRQTPAAVLFKTPEEISHAANDGALEGQGKHSILTVGQSNDGGNRLSSHTKHDAVVHAIKLSVPNGVAAFDV
jgi:hypothetical protein